MYRKSPEYRRRETELYDKIRNLSERFDQVRAEGKDTTEILKQLGVALEEFYRFRRKFKEGI
jgi:hypothetical protein